MHMELEWGHFRLQMLPEMKSRVKMSKHEFYYFKCINNKVGFGIASSLRVIREAKIEITSWKARAYGIFTRVGEVSEIERVSAANE